MLLFPMQEHILEISQKLYFIEKGSFNLHKSSKKRTIEKSTSYGRMKELPWEVLLYNQ